MKESTKALESAEFIRARLSGSMPEIAVVLGSGFKAFSQNLKKPLVLPMAEIPHFSMPKVQGHGGSLLIGQLPGLDTNIALFDGRIHLYEGFSAAQVVFPVRVMAKLGVKKILLTNAAGGLNADLKPGEVVVLNDQINLTGQNCLVGYESELGPQFVDMIDCFDKAWREKIAAATSLRQGTYLGLLGPTYETPAETRAFGNMGANVVGMSTVQEVIAARQMGLKVAALSLVTNLAGGLSKKVNHQEVLETAKNRAGALQEILTKAILAAFA